MHASRDWRRTLWLVSLSAYTALRGLVVARLLLCVGRPNRRVGWSSICRWWLLLRMILLGDRLARCGGCRDVWRSS
jgi:hypothetical protein